MRVDERTMNELFSIFLTSETIVGPTGQMRFSRNLSEVNRSQSPASCIGWVHLEPNAIAIGTNVTKSVAKTVTMHHP